MAFIPAAIEGIGSLAGGTLGGLGSALTGGASAATGIGSALTTAGTLVSGVGGFEKAAAGDSAARYNAAAAQAEARSTLQAGSLAEQQQRLQTAQTIGAATAAYGAAGVDAGSGTPLQVNASTAQIGEFDALTTRANYQNRANALETQSQGYLSSQVSPFLAGATSALSTYGNSLNSAASRNQYSQLARSIASGE